MKKLTFNLIFLLFTKLVIGQGIDSKNIELLTNEITQIKNSESFVQFLTNHAATYKDFDSLLSILEGTPCPENFTYNLINGDSNKVVNVNEGFLFLVGRNFFQQNAMDKELSSIKEQKTFINYLLTNLNTFLEDPFTNWYNSYQKILAEITNKIHFKIDSIKIEPILVSYNEKADYKQINSNWKAWIKKIDFRAKDLFESNQNSKNELVTYIIRQEGEWETRFWEQIKDQDDGFLKNDLGGSIIAENISSYISAQVFKDIAFFEINGKLVWLDVSP